MAVATFDTLKFANTLKAAGVPDKQAEAQAVAFAEVIQANFKELYSARLGLGRASRRRVCHPFLELAESLVRHRGCS